MKRPIDDIREFSEKTGIKDPLLDTMLSQQGLGLDRMAPWSNNTSTATNAPSDSGELDVDAVLGFLREFAEAQYKPANKHDAIDGEWHVVPDKELPSGESLE